jgi:lipoate-protein ligase A
MEIKHVLKNSLWRLIDTGHLLGPDNMAIDESLLCSFDPISSDPILRLYGWKSPSLSLGRFQNAGDVLDLERCYTNAIPIIRRVSGGGAIYHAGELTYSIVCTPEHIPVASSVKDSFRILTGFLIDFYTLFGLNASYALDTVFDVAQLGVRTAFCFAGKESFDILIEGKKMGGNAQRRNKNIIFQHGSIPIENHSIAGLEYMNDRSPAYAQGTTSLLDCGVPNDLSKLKSMLIKAFKDRMNVDVYSSQLSIIEQNLYKKFLADKYTADSWNLQGELA